MIPSITKFLCIGMLTLGLVHAEERPNVLIIFADDLGYADTGFTGSKEIFTPNLDKLAAGGVVINNGYVTHPYCGPSRAGLLSGRHQARFGLEINLTYSPYDLHSGLPATEKTFGKRLQGAGYRTGIIGKWHLGASYPFHPNNRGFDYFFGFLSGGHDYFPDTVTTSHPLLQPNGKTHYSGNEGCFLPLERNKNAAKFDEYLTTALSRDAAKFVKESEKPFCLYLSYNAPHGPLQAPKKTIAKYKHIDDWHRRIYAAMIDEMDSGIGMVVDSLKASGKYDNTLIFFLSDNGEVWNNKDPENPKSYADNSPFIKGKGSLYEGGTHVPFFVHWPAGLKKTGTFDGLVSALDIAATAIAVGKGDATSPTLEGVNLIPYLNGEKQGSPHPALYWREGNGHLCAVRTPDAKLIQRAGGKGAGTAVFDMRTDPYEGKDLSNSSPELRAELAGLWNKWNAQNTTCFLQQADRYQKSRLKFYHEQYERLKKSAEGRAQRQIK